MTKAYVGLSRVLDANFNEHDEEFENALEGGA